MKCDQWCFLCRYPPLFLIYSYRTLGAENLLLRGATLKNTGHIYGKILTMLLKVFRVFMERLLQHLSLLLFGFSCCCLHWHGDQDGSELPVKISEALCCGKVYLRSLTTCFFSVLFTFCSFITNPLSAMSFCAGQWMHFWLFICASWSVRRWSTLSSNTLGSGPLIEMNPGTTIGLRSSVSATWFVKALCAI